MDNTMIAFILLFVSMFGSSMIQAKSLKDLDQDKKTTLIQLFAKSRFYFLGILLGILLLFFCSINFNGWHLLLLQVFILLYWLPILSYPVTLLIRS